MSVSSTHYYRFEYLKSAHWSDLRLRKLCETDARCEICKTQNFSNDVHHLRYKQLFDVETSDLKTLCRRCHNYIHNALEEIRNNPIANHKREWEKAERHAKRMIASEAYPAYQEARRKIIRELIVKSGFSASNAEKRVPPAFHEQAISWYYSIKGEPTSEQWNEASDKWGTWMCKLQS